jgi:hypothetical protein
MLHFANQLTLKQLQALERRIVYGREGRKRAIHSALCTSG